MIYQSDAITLRRHDNGILEMQFDLKGESVNKFNQLTVQCLTETLDALDHQRQTRIYRRRGYH
jgi:3-hydroxyacyl-CoA dehydrogenase/enoyl-CoA hydratase/3-hydroxybutyryl-CoA epimerase/enoyl-CoA isomerase